MSAALEDGNRRMLRARDAMDRAYAAELDLAAVAQVACVSEDHFGRQFRATFGETPHQYLRRRRLERAMWMLRDSDASVTEICLDVGFVSLGSFSATFRRVVGQTPTQYRAMARAERRAQSVPACFAMAWLRPRF